MKEIDILNQLREEGEIKINFDESNDDLTRYVIDLNSDTPTPLESEIRKIIGKALSEYEGRRVNDKLKSEIKDKIFEVFKNYENIFSD